jgi:DNA-binding IscR family transcriptional regulator
MNELSKRALSTLMVAGAQSVEKAMSVEELAAKLNVPRADVAVEVDGLVGANYARAVGGGGNPSVYLTGTGVITASSTYS